MNRKLKRILSECKERILAEEPAAKIVLYGSYARGDAGEYSDLDLLVLVPETASWSDRLSIQDSTYPIQLKHGILIACLVETEENWNTKMKPTPLYKNVEREGVPI